MKCTIITLILTVVFFFDAKSQADTLVINLKNNQVEKIPISQIQKITFENVTGVDNSINPPKDLTIKGNYPNPFDEKTNIEFEIASFGDVVIIIYDNNGNQIQKLKCQNCQAGKNNIQWNCLDKNNNQVRSGVYYYEVRFNNEIQSKKMILIK